MGKTKLENIIFTLIMCFCMVFGMTFYNAFLRSGTAGPETLKNTFQELPAVYIIALLVELLVVGRLAGLFMSRATRKGVSEQVSYYVSGMFICSIMCPIMTFVAMMINNPEPSFTAWFESWTTNIKFAICLQLLYAGPIVRTIFRFIFRKKPSKNSK